MQYLVERIADETRPTLLVGFPNDADVLDAVPVGATGSLLPVAATTHGVLDAIDVGDLAVLAAHIDGWIEVTIRSVPTSRCRRADRGHPSVRR